jgi:hypothetical protein
LNSTTARRKFENEINAVKNEMVSGILIPDGFEHSRVEQRIGAIAIARCAQRVTQLQQPQTNETDLLYISLSTSITSHFTPRTLSSLLSKSFAISSSEGKPPAVTSDASVNVQCVSMADDGILAFCNSLL